MINSSAKSTANWFAASRDKHVDVPFWAPSFSLWPIFFGKLTPDVDED
jgi:hypothetical protein